ncbi:MAG: hypothetical protein V3V01_11910 [Acidimicrobiales bacterium]
MSSDEIIEAATELLELDPPRAEIWVSGLLADLDPGEHDELIEQMTLSNSPASVTLAATLAVVADESLASRSAEIVSNSEVQGPWWLDALGSATPIEAVRVTVDGEPASLIFRFEHSSEHRHLLLIDIDDGVAADIRLAPDGLLDESTGDNSIVFSPVPVADAGADAAAAMELADRGEPSIALNMAVARRRVESVQNTELSVESRIANEPAGESAGRDSEGDLAAVAVLESVLASRFTEVPGPDLFTEVAYRLRAPDESSAADVDAVFAAAGLTGSEPDDELVLRFVGAYAAAHQLVLFGSEEQQAIRHLEWADWLGAVIGTVRAGIGTEVTPAGLVKAINRCPEITTTIPKADADYVGWAFELTLHAWAMVGVIDERDCLTEFGEKVLPFALRATWTRT